MKLQLKDRSIDLNRPLIMGILNVTPDSFSDGGLYVTRDRALAQAERMIKEGADIIDIGGESTRPGAAEVSPEQEMERVCPVVEELKNSFDTVISVDTSQPAVIRQCADLGADIWNDIRALSVEGAVDTALELRLCVCLMHMQGQPRTMQDNPHYEDVVGEVRDFLLQRARVLTDRGFERERIIIDPGFGFGKSAQDNYRLLCHLEDLAGTGYTLLSALSRKSMIGFANHIEKASERVPGSVAGAVISVLKGANIVRVHDVEPTRQALEVFEQMNRYAAAR